MSVNAPLTPIHHLQGEGDQLLSLTALKVQLPAGYYAEAATRYRTLASWLDREKSPLRGLIERIYAQGAMSYGAVIANKATNDEYDVDAMVEVKVSEATDPKWMLDTLFEAIRGEEGSLYHGMTTRHTRCVQVRYADKMHIDLTPAVLRAARPERESVIFHHRAETPSLPGQHVIANPYAFGEWFQAQNPPDLAMYLGTEDGLRLLEKSIHAETEPLPEQKHPLELSRGLVALQLFKRFRNLRYDNRDARCPPGILLAYQIGAYKCGGVGLGKAVLAHAVNLRDLVSGAVAQNRLLHACNPECPEDELTDRWPADMRDQTTWLRDLEYLVSQLTIYVLGQPTIATRRDILADLFGETVAGRVLTEFAEQLGRGKADGSNRYLPGVGTLVLPAAPGLNLRGRPEPKTQFFGGALSWHRG